METWLSIRQVALLKKNVQGNFSLQVPQLFSQEKSTRVNIWQRNWEKLIFIFFHKNDLVYKILKSLADHSESSAGHMSPVGCCLDMIDQAIFQYNPVTAVGNWFTKDYTLIILLYMVFIPASHQTRFDTGPFYWGDSGWWVCVGVCWWSVQVIGSLWNYASHC